MPIKAGLLMLEGLSEQEVIEVLQHKARHAYLHGAYEQSISCHLRPKINSKAAQELTLAWENRAGFDAILQILKTIEGVDLQIASTRIDFSSYYDT